MKKLFSLLSIILCMSGLSFGQQVPQFSQYMFNPLFINPAYTGYKEQLYLQTYYRKQWAGVEGSPETFALGADGYLADKNLGVGLSMVSDRIGAQRTNAVYGNLAYHLRLDDSRFLSFGAGLGFMHSLLDGGMLTPGQINDPSVPAVKNNVAYPDIKLGLFYYDDNKFLGIAADNVLGPVLDLEKGDIIVEPSTHFYLSGGGLLEISEDIAMRPSFMFMDDFRAPARLDLNSSWIYKEKYWIGASYRTAVDYSNRSISDNTKKSTAVVVLLEFYVTEGLRVGYAYDHNITGFNVRNFSTHDISIGYLLAPKRVRLISPRHF